MAVILFFLNSSNLKNGHTICMPSFSPKQNFMDKLYSPRNTRNIMAVVKCFEVQQYKQYNYHTVLLLQHKRNALQLSNLKMPRQITMNPNAAFR